MPHLRPAIVTILGAALLAASVSVRSQTPGTDWELGDFIVSLGHPSQGTGGKHDLYAGDGQAKGETLVDPARGFTGGCALDPRTGYLSTTSYFRNTVTTFDDLHPHAILRTIETRSASGGRAVESIVFDVSPKDPMVFATVAFVLSGVIVAAGYLPARRATRVSPLDALRSE